MWPGPILNSTTGSLSLSGPSQLAKLPDPTSPGVLEGLEPNSSASCQSLILLLPGPPGLICCSVEQPSEQPLPFPGRKLGLGLCLFPQHFLPLLIWTYLAGHLVLKGPGQAVYWSGFRDQIWAVLKGTAGREGWPEANLSFMGCLQAEHSKLIHSYPINRPLALEIAILLETIFSGVKLG